MTERLFSDAAASAYALRRWLEHDVRRTATLILWSVYSPAEGLSELQGIGRMHDIRCKRLDCSSDMVAREMLVEEYRRQSAIHEATCANVRAAVLTALRDAGDQERAAAAAARIAEAAELPPPPHLFGGAIEAAIREFRFAAKRWTRGAA